MLSVDLKPANGPIAGNQPKKSRKLSEEFQPTLKILGATIVEVPELEAIVRKVLQRQQQAYLGHERRKQILSVCKDLLRLEAGFAIQISAPNKIRAFGHFVPDLFCVPLASDLLRKVQHY